MFDDAGEFKRNMRLYKMRITDDDGYTIDVETRPRGEGRY
jgi:hypothetical protein